MTTHRYLLQHFKKSSNILSWTFAFGGGYKNGGLSDGATELLSKHMAPKYMGSAEYEFGGLANSLYQISKNSENYISKSFKLLGKEIFFVCSQR